MNTDKLRILSLSLSHLCLSDFHPWLIQFFPKLQPLIHGVKFYPIRSIADRKLSPIGSALSASYPIPAISLRRASIVGRAYSAQHSTNLSYSQKTTPFPQRFPSADSEITKHRLFKRYEIRTCSNSEPSKL